MFALDHVLATPDKMEERKEVRMHRADRARIRAAVEAPREGCPGMVLAVKTVRDVPKDGSWACGRKEYAGQ